MGRPVKNELHIDPLPDGRWRLHGYWRGQRIRQRSRDLAALEAARSTLEGQLATAACVDSNRPHPRLTWLTDEQLRDAEAAALNAAGRRLVECVAAAERVLPPIGGKTCADALTEWLLALTKRKRSPLTLEKNERRVRDFLRHCGATYLEGIRPLMVEAWVLRGGRADYTQITDAQVVRAWLNFCVSRRWLLVSPFEVDMPDLSATARTKAPARILTPEQCRALLAAAQTTSGGRMLPYVILACWCFMSPQEIIRTTRGRMKLDAATPVIEVDTVKRRTAKFRTVTIPANVLPLLREAVKDWQTDRAVEFARVPWDRVRAAAGLVKLNPVCKGRRSHKGSQWQSSILRHTGISYFYQRSRDIKETCRQAGNTSDAAFRHYLSLPTEGAADRFYASPAC